MSSRKKNNNRSAKYIMIIFSLVIVLLVSNVVYLGATGKHFISGSDIKGYAEDRGGGQKQTTIYAKRGTIYSSDDEVLVSDVKKYKLYAVISTSRKKANGDPAYVVDKEKTAKELSKIIGMKKEKILQRLNSDSYQVEFGQYGNNLSSLVKDKIDALELPGLEFEEFTSRHYRYGDFASYEIGYAQALQGDATKEIVGQMGIEKTFNEELTGENGKRVYLADSNNYILPNGILSEDQPVSGNDIYLTIDSSIQTELDLQMEKVVKAAKADKMACAVMEAKTGRILAISNYPSFDPNTKEIDNYVDLVFNEAVEPGSVFKTFVYANAIEDKKLDVNKTYQSGVYQYKANGRVVHTIRDHNQGRGWGTITYETGYRYSSNTAICNILTRYTDKQSLIQDFKDLQLFKASEIDGMTSGSGVAGFEGQNRNLEWLTTGFGQGSTVTAIQLLRGYSAFANDGKTVEPYLVEKVVNSETGQVAYQAQPEYSQKIYSTDTVKQMRDLMSLVINQKGSTGYKYHMNDIHLIGKTGTGQIAKNGKYMEDYYTHSFVGLAPYDDPQIVITFWYQSEITATGQASQLVKAVTRASLNKLNEQPVKEVETSTFVLDSYANQSVQFAKEIISKHQLTPIVIGNGKTVLNQYPLSETEVSAKTKVFLQTDGIKITMPSMKGWSRKEVEAFASMADVNIDFKGTGTVYKQSVTKGKALKSNQKITVYAK